MLRKIFAFIVISLVVGVSVFLGMQTHRSKEQTFDHNGVTRKYRLHLPKDYSEEKKYPLVIMLHGYFTNGRFMEIQTGMSRRADSEGFIVVYPEATKKGIFDAYAWNSGFCCGSAFEEGVNDADFVMALIEKLQKEEAVDSEKVFLVGNSNGAMLADYLALNYSDKFKAAAIIAGAVGGKQEDEKEFTYHEKKYNPISVLIVHGRKDTVVPFDGGKRKGSPIEFTGAYDNLNFWLENNECSKHPSEVSNQDEYTLETYLDCKNDTSVVFYAVDAGHNWSGSFMDFMNVITNRAVSSTDLVIDFFSL